MRAFDETDVLYRLGNESCSALKRLGKKDRVGGAEQFEFWIGSVGTKVLDRHPKELCVSSVSLLQTLVVPLNVVRGLLRSVGGFLRARSRSTL